ncbi:SurA N-terminal domain-containing protein [Psychrosphaera sp. B3R10]|uniref:SurA N-terminal domain-containing protein n=1 Tax=unclassified Psychrosphaera TaxID=2641570 RepID=UPI001C0A5CD2|nr:MULTISPECIES: SurA N-terminal domain-containing protein [unclassified Psychrosphaera]MBU2880905.1 SurA N-terminal domain-containing protein [Psychrosphaera sp. I2R16]MBU2990876.1 SurA N-terminal domain-containing protein [Psychrosphaera sp. B3R10]MDO6720572.1 SurA N-terminal domain-containing protein [Psychrosphaera sp. 1_MG-2023]
MLERIREGSQGIVAKSVLGLVIFTFAISGIGSYINSTSDSTVISVNGVEITKSEVDQAYQNGRQQLQSQYGEMVEQLFADEAYVATYREQIIDNLVVEELQKQQAKEIGVRVSDEQIRKAIIEMPAFQLAGEFSNDIYLAKIRQAGYSASQFREMLRQQLSRTQFAGSVMGSEFVLPSEKQQFAALFNQTRSFDLVKFDAKALEASITLEEADIKNYFELNASRYQTQEKISFEYILIDSEKLASKVVVSEEELKTYYTNNIAEFTTAEKRRISHILVESGDAAKVAEIQAKLDAGENFADVAKSLSEDSFSAENGGDLEYFESGVFGDAFDSAVTSLSTVGEVSPLVETDGGQHFITLTELTPEVVKPFAEVKETIAEEARQSKVAELYIEAQTKVTEVAFEVPDDLTDAAKEAGLELSTQKLASRYQLTGDLSNPLLVNKVFDVDFISEGLNSDLIELSDTKSIVVRALEHEASRPQTLEEVKGLVTSALTKQKASELAQEQAKALLAKISEGFDYTTDTSLAAETFTRVDRNNTAVDRAVKEHVFTMPKPATDATSSDWVDMANGSAAVVVLKAVDVNVNGDKNAGEQVAGILSQATNKAFIESARLSAEIER